MKIIIPLIALIAVALTGCGTTHNLNKSMVGADCQTHDECAAMMTLPSPPKPDARFFVAAASGENRMGLAGPKYSLYLDLCVAKALAEFYPNAHIALGDERPIADTIPTVVISNLRDLRTNAWSGNLKMDGDIQIKPVPDAKTERIEITATGSKGFFTMGAKSALYNAAPRLCKDFAVEVNDEIKKAKVFVATTEKMNLDTFEICKNGAGCKNSLFLKVTNNLVIKDIPIDVHIKELITKDGFDLMTEENAAQNAANGIHVHMKTLRFKEGDASGGLGMLFMMIGGLGGVMFGGPAGLGAMMAMQSAGQAGGAIVGAAAGSAIQSYTGYVEATVLTKNGDGVTTDDIEAKISIKVDPKDPKAREIILAQIAKAIAEEVVDTVKLHKAI